MPAPLRSCFTVIFATAVAVLCCVFNTYAATDGPFEIHEMSFWLTESNSTQINAQAGYPSAMPGSVDSVRGRSVEPGRPEVQPLGVIFFHGKPPEVADFFLRIPIGRALATWPPAENKNNRLAWKDLKFSATPGGSELFSFVPEGHWFERARKMDVLQLQRGARTEKFIAYDPELNVQFSMRVEGGPDQYKIANGSKYALKDVLFIIPGKEGPRLGWLDDLPGTQPAKAAAAKKPPAINPEIEKAGKAVADTIASVTGAVSRQVAAVVPAAAPASPETSTELQVSPPLNALEFERQGAGELKTRLAAAGLHESEIELLTGLYSKAIFASNEPVLLFRLPQSTLDELLPLEVDPENTKTVRVALVMCLKIDPRIRDEVKTLIDQLADEDFGQRETAEKRLYALGRMAFPALKDAAKSKDPEQAMRAERLLLQQKEKLDAK
jgi:hypothetical protein